MTSSKKDPLRSRTLIIKYLPPLLGLVAPLLLFVTIVIHMIIQLADPVWRDSIPSGTYEGFHLPALSEAGAGGPGRFLFGFVCVMASLGFVMLGVIGWAGAMETVATGRSRFWLFVHYVRCVIWILAGCCLYLVGEVPLRDMASDKDAWVTFWEVYNVSTPIHLGAAFGFFVCCVLAMLVGTVLAMREVRLTRMSKQAKFLVVAWKGLTMLAALVCWPVLPIIGVVLVAAVCDLKDANSLMSCWPVKANQVAIGALCQWGFVLCVCQHVTSYIWDLKNSALTVNPDISLKLFREMNTDAFAGEDEFKVDSELDDMPSTGSF